MLLPHVFPKRSHGAKCLILRSMTILSAMLFQHKSTVHVTLSAHIVLLSFPNKRMNYYAALCRFAPEHKHAYSCQQHQSKPQTRAAVVARLRQVTKILLRRLKSP